jgi:thiol:disulfide interchange protein
LQPPGKAEVVKKRYCLIAGLHLSLLLVAYVQWANPQEARRRTPTLTNDDITRTRSTSVIKPETETPAASDTAGGAISWERDLRRALQTAQDENKLIIVDVYTDWCVWCKRMDADIYSDPQVVGLSREEVFLKLDAEDGDQGQQFAQRMGVRGYPTTFILDSRGRAVGAQVGYIRTPAGFIDFVQRTRRQSGNH